MIGSRVLVKIIILRIQYKSNIKHDNLSMIFDTLLNILAMLQTDSKVYKSAVSAQTMGYEEGSEIYKEIRHVLCETGTKTGSPPYQI